MNRWLGAVLCALLTASTLTPVVAHAQGQPAPVMPAAVPARVDVEVMVIRASEAPGPIDPRLEPMLPMLRTTPFKSFTLLDQHAVRLADAEEQAVRLTESRRLKVHLVTHDGAQAKVRIELVSEEAKILDTTVSITRNKSFFLAVRGTGGTSLIVPVSVRY